MLTLITPTRGRGRLFGNLEEFIDRQTYRGDVQWIVVCSGGREGYRFNLGQVVIDRNPCNDDPSLHDLQHNYLAALPFVRGDKVFLVEDDDYYGPSYLATLAAALDDVALVGVCPAFYYHCPARKWRSLGNRDHASLAATAFRSEVLPSFAAGAAVPGNKYIDCWLWSEWPRIVGGSWRLLPQDDKRPFQVGLKGLTGDGAGLGHDDRPGIADPDYTVLRRWLGEHWSKYALRS